MGCDIHICLERKETIDGKSVWVNIDPHIFNEYQKEFRAKGIAEDRDYELFCILAGVRDRQGVKPIDSPRGIPDDCHDITRSRYEYYSGDAHTPSYFSLGELKEYQDSCDGQIKRSGMISPEQHEALLNGEKPDAWCQGTTDASWVHAEWTDKCNPIESFISKIENYLNCILYSYELRNKVCNFRVVFWFDN